MEILGAGMLLSGRVGILSMRAALGSTPRLSGYVDTAVSPAFWVKGTVSLRSAWAA